MGAGVLCMYVSKYLLYVMHLCAYAYIFFGCCKMSVRVILNISGVSFLAQRHNCHMHVSIHPSLKS